MKITSDLAAREKLGSARSVTDEYFYDSYKLTAESICALATHNYTHCNSAKSTDYFLPTFDLDISLKLRQVPFDSLPNIVYGFPLVAFALTHLDSKEKSRRFPFAFRRTVLRTFSKL